MAFVELGDRFTDNQTIDNKPLRGHEFKSAKPNVYSFNSRSKKVSFFDIKQES
jgi:hypothetical protein